MAQLTLEIPHPLGPLYVDIIGDRGRKIGPRLTLSSSQRSVAVGGMPPGYYTIVATRPSGEQLVVSACVEASGGEVKIEAPSGVLGFPSRLNDFGLTHNRPDVASAAIWSPRLETNSMRSLSVLLQSELTSGRRDLTSYLGPNRHFVAGRHELSLVGWVFDQRRWRRTENFAVPEIFADGYLMRLSLTADRPMALGLIDEWGFGPIVMVPNFALGTDVTFASAG